MEKKNTKRSISRYLYFIVTSIAIIFSIALPSLKVSAEEAEDWELFYFGDDDENLKVYYSASLGKLKAEIPSNIAVKEWIGQGSSGQSVPSMFSGLSYHSISIGKEVTNLDGRVMKGVTVLDELVIEDGNTKYVQNDGIVTNASGDALVFVTPGASSDDLVLPDSITKIADHAFDGNKKIGKVTGKKVKSIGSFAFDSSSVTEFAAENIEGILYNAFQECDKLEKITSEVDDGISLGSHVFLNCTNLTGFPYKATYEMSAFENCSSFTSFTLPEDLTTIPNGLFEKCRGLTYIEIPASVTSIEYSTFKECSGLKEIKFHSLTPPEFGADVFLNCPAEMKITVPAGAEDAYLEKLGDGYYENINETGVTKYSLYVGDKQFKSNQLSLQMGEGTAKFDPETNTLTLDHATIDKGTAVITLGWGRYGGCIYSGLSNLTIEVIGENKISADIDGISTAVGCSVTLKGSGSLDIETDNTEDKYVRSVYVGFGDDPTDVDAGDFIVDGPKLTTNLGIEATRNLIFRGGSEVLTPSRINSNNNGNITIEGGAKVSAGMLSLGLPDSMFSSELYKRDMVVTVDGGELTITGNSIYFENFSGGADDPRGHIKLISGAIKIEKAPKEGEKVANCPNENVEIAEEFKMTVDEFQAGNIEKTTYAGTVNVTIDMGGHGSDISFRVPEGTVINERSILERQDLQARIKDEVTFGGVRLKPLSKFTGYEEYYKDDNNFGIIEGSTSGYIGWTKEVREDLRIYACWFLPITEVSLSIKAPVCGKTTEYKDTKKSYEMTYQPEVGLPEGVHFKIKKDIDSEDKLFDSLYWFSFENDDYYTGSFSAEKEYGALINLEADFGYVFTNEVKVTMDGAELKDSKTDLNHGVISQVSCNLEVFAKVAPYHSYGEWASLDDTYHQKVCVGDAAHVQKEVHQWDGGRITKEATEAAKGEKTYTCLVCGAEKKEEIPKKSSSVVIVKPDPTDPKKMGEDGTAYGTGASKAAVDKGITSSASEKDKKGTVYGLLQLKASKTTKNSVTVKWQKVKGAKTYLVYANNCGKKNKCGKVGELTSKKSSFTLNKKTLHKALKKGTYYKLMVVALDKNDMVLSTSKIVHSATKGGKVGDHKKVTTKAKKNKVSIKVKKTFKLNAKAVPASKKLKVGNHRKIQYETSNGSVATVNAKGVIKGVKKGVCYVYAYAQNGVAAKIKVTVK